MKKNIIAIAVAAAVIAPTMASAEGDVKVYGRAQVEVANVDPQAANSDAAVEVTDNSMGRLGVVATEDLGGGLKGIAKFEMKLDTADGDADSACNTVDAGEDVAENAGAGDGNTDEGTVGCSKTAGISLTKREFMVGLKGGFGQVELGRLKSAYKYAGGVKYDPFVATLLEARGNGGMSGGKTMIGGVNGQYGHNSFNSNMIGYNSPKLGPISLRFTYGPEENDGTMTGSVKGSWKMGEFFVTFLDTGDKLNKGVGSKAYSAFKAGGQIRFAGSHKISLQYEVTDYDDGVAGNTDASPAYIFAGYQGGFGKSVFVAQFGSYDEDIATVGTAKNNDATYLALGAMYKFSKMTRVFGGYRSTDRDNDSGQDVITIGLRKDFK